MEERKEINFRVYRFNPQVDSKPFYDNFRITVEKGITVLRALNYVKEHLEPRLSYRAFCQAGICGSCGMKINGVSKLACTTQVWDEIDENAEENVISIEPLANLDVVRDMVVDMDPVIDRLRTYRGWVETSKEESELGKKEFFISEKEFLKYDKATDCILCASCLSECTITGADRRFISPLMILRADRFQIDSRDRLKEERMNVLVRDHGIWDCTHCYRCQEVCVKDIPIMNSIHSIRHQAILSRGRNDSEGSRHAVLFEDDIETKGRLVEMTLPMRTLGMIKFALLAPSMLGMILKGRTPPPPFLMKSVPGVKKLKQVLRQFKKDQKESKGKG